MDIIQRDNKYFLQLANGELELSEQQVKKRVERGDQLHEYLQKLERKEPKALVKEISKTAQSFITSGKYFDNLIREFEQIHKLSEDKEDAVEKLVRFCKNAINKLQQDRKNPKTDHVVIDYYILSWSRVISFIQSLSNTEPEAPPVVEAPKEIIVQKPQNLIRQLLMIQLLQADGLFPISDALMGISQDDILLLISGVLDADKEAVQEAIHQSSVILMKRGISQANREERTKLLEDMEQHFEKLPYSNVINRIKSLLKSYRSENS